MGVRGLYSYVIKTSEGSFEPFTLKNTKIIIDGRSLSYRLFDLSQQNRTTKYIIGSDYEAFSRFVTDFFKKLMFHKVNFLLVMNGCFRPGNREKIEQKHTKCLSSNVDPFLYDRKEGIHYAAFKDDVFMSVIKKLRIKFVKCTFDSDEVIAVTSKILGYPVLTANSDYFFYGNDCILFNTIELNKNTLQLTNKMACKIYRSDKFIKSFPGLDISCLSLLSVLMDQNYFNDELLKEILKFQSSANVMIENYNKIRAALYWLSNHTLESASSKICSLLTPVEKSPKPIKKFIEAHINRFTTFSKLTLEFLVTEPLLEITEEKISSVKDKFFKFTMDDKKKSPSEKLHDNLVERDDDIIKKKVLSLTPDWLLRCHMKGHIHSFIFSMIGLRTFIPWDHLEDLNYPCAYEMSISLIELIDRLLLSCMKNYSLQPLNLMARTNRDIYYKTIKIDSYPKSLGALRKSDVKNRLKIINNVLRIADSENFQDLPENWRLYVATAVFWFKQDVAPKKNKNHMKALLLAMFFVVVKNIIHLKKSKCFNEQYNETIKKIMSTSISHHNQKDEITTIQAIENICNNDALIAANYMMPLVENQTKILNQPPSFHLSTETIHIYSQFEICLKFSKTLNSLLNMPYYQIKVEQMLMRPLIYNLYLDISQHSNVDKYIADKFNHAPTVLKCFKLLSKKVDSLLNE
ncbi:protein asteroid-like [Chelonus insularis]|uniref:protein asteroid-like n=1 Tax=Chelonus insularis TaxID=460826 RepID=UPI0015883B20|nr:protein asteroid-like [Chelonus insularis]